MREEGRLEDATGKEENTKDRDFNAEDWQPKAGPSTGVKGGVTGVEQDQETVRSDHPIHAA